MKLKHYSGYEDVDHLIRSVDKIHLQVTPGEAKGALPPGFICAKVTASFGRFDCLIDDEYQDVDGRNHPRALQALLLTILDFLDDEIDLGSSSEEAQELLNGSIAFWAQYEDKISPAKRIVSPFSWQLNSGDAQILRKLPHQFAQPFLYAQEVCAYVNAFEPMVPLFMLKFADERRLIVMVELNALQKEFYSAQSAIQIVNRYDRQLLESRLFGMGEQDGKSLPTGQWFSYWCSESSEGAAFSIAKFTPGEPVQVISCNPEDTLIREYDTYDEATHDLHERGFLNVANEQ